MILEIVIGTLRKRERYKFSSMRKFSKLREITNSERMRIGNFPGVAFA